MLMQVGALNAKCCIRMTVLF